MQDKLILYPIFPLLALTVFVYLRTFVGRLKGVKSGEVDPKFYKTYDQGSEPRALAASSRHITNLMELPVIFYLTCILIYAAGINTLLLTICAWLFVLSRFIHSYVHLGKNNVVHRYKIFFIGVINLVVIWIASLIGVIQL